MPLPFVFLCLLWPQENALSREGEYETAKTLKYATFRTRAFSSPHLPNPQIPFEENPLSPNPHVPFPRLPNSALLSWSIPLALAFYSVPFTNTYNAGCSAATTFLRFPKEPDSLRGRPRADRYGGIERKSWRVVFACRLEGYRYSSHQRERATSPPLPPGIGPVYLRIHRPVYLSAR